MVDLPSQLELSLRILLAMVLAGLVGFEREVNDHPAGLRTHIAVGLGAALFAVVSAYGFGEFAADRADTNYNIDVTRISSQIVSGMGFLGGGAILKYGANVHGLTTAASLWVTAAIGLACAMGSYTVALVTTGAVLVSLVFLRMPREWIARRLSRDKETVVIRLSPKANPGPVIAALTAIDGVDVTAIRVRNDDDATYVEADCEGPRGTELEARLSALALRDDVAEVQTA